MESETPRTDAKALEIISITWQSMRLKMWKDHSEKLELEIKKLKEKAIIEELYHDTEGHN